MTNSKLCLVGAGNMGGAMLNGWLDTGYDPSLISVLDPSPPPPIAALINKFDVALFSDAQLVPRPDFIIVAVKPQIIRTVLPGIVSLVDDENALLSVAAGTTIANLSEPFSDVSPRIIRAMPNTPAQVARGITVCVANDRVSEDQKTILQKLLTAIGQVEWVDDESLIDAVTGVSGSGPAYVFHMTEALAAAGEKAGLSPELAATLAKATVSGGGELMRLSELSPSELRENVTSPNGTTAAALKILMAEDGFNALLERAVAAATARSRELAE